MRKISNYLSKKLSKEEIKIFHSNLENEIEYEILNDRFHLYRIRYQNEFIQIFQFEDDEFENEIFRMNYLIFEDDEFLLLDIIEKFIENQIEYFK